MSINKEYYPLSNLRYFSAYNEQTKELIYSKYTFNFDLYASDFHLINKTKLEIFDDFLIRNQFDYGKPTVVLEKLKKYFYPMTQKVINYNNYYASCVHSGYFNIQGLNTFVSNKELLENQFDLFYYNDTQIRRLQDYYYVDNQDNIYSKYNFNFHLYSLEFNVYANKLITFTDFVYRTLNLSGNILGTRSYGDPGILKKYFIQSADLNNYLVNYSVNCIFNNSNKSLNNIDYKYYSELANIQEESLENIKENYIRKGQFIQYELKFIYPELNNIQKIIKSVGVVNTGNIGAGFLYTHYNNPNLIYLITCNHLITSANLETFRASFELFDYTNESITTSAEFKVIGRDIHSDVLVGLFDPELSYNKVFNIDLTPYKKLKIDINSILRIGDEVDVIGHIGRLDNRTFLNGKIMDPNFTGSFIENSYIIPNSVLVDLHINEGISGSPLFLSKNNELSVSGIINGKVGNNQQYTVALNPFILQSVISQIIENYSIYSKYYKTDLVSLSNSIKLGLPQKWLGIEGYYYDPISNESINSILNNLPYNGGLIINKFILGFDYINQKYIYDTESLNQLGIFRLNSPLLNTKLYDRFINSNKSPIVIKSLTFFEGLNGNYNKFNIGKYSNQIGHFIYQYGLLPTGNFTIEDTTYDTKIGYTYGKIIFEYYYYNGQIWELEEDTIGGNTSDWYNLYVDTNNNKYYQHKFEFPKFLTSYDESYVTYLNESALTSGSVNYMNPINNNNNKNNNNNNNKNNNNNNKSTSKSTSADSSTEYGVLINKYNNLIGN